MDTLYIKQFACKTYIGIYEWEKNFPQTVLIDLEIAVDAKKISETDAIENTYNYDVLTKHIANFLQNKHFNLIETLAEKIAEFILEKFSIPRLKLTVVKPKALKKATEVSIVIERKTPTIHS